MIDDNFHGIPAEDDLKLVRVLPYRNVTEISATIRESVPQMIENITNAWRAPSPFNDLFRRT